MPLKYLTTLLLLLKMPHSDNALKLPKVLHIASEIKYLVNFKIK